MVQAAIAVFILALVAYSAAAFFAIISWRSGEGRHLSLAKWFTQGGAGLLILLFALRWSHWHMLPLTNSFDFINVFALMTSCIVIATQWLTPYSILSIFYLPPVAAICLMNAFIASRYFLEPPRELQGLFLLVHVGLALFAYALFFVASLTSAAYLVQVRHLKRPAGQGFVHQLPPLERLDKLLYGLVKLGYPLFAFTLVVGVVWAWRDRDLLGPSWWLSPKIAMSFFMAMLFSASFHTRRFGILRGPKLASLIFFGFNVLLALFLLMSLLGLRNYNFWGQGA